MYLAVEGELIPTLKSIRFAQDSTKQLSQGNNSF